MENPSPFDLNEAIRRWQQNLAASPAFGAENLEELASHLCASVQKLKADGHSEEEAFQIAARRLGERGALEREFAKVNPAAPWSWPVISFWTVTGIYLFLIVYSLICGILALRQLLEMRDIHRLIAGGADSNHILDHLRSFHYLPRSFAPMLGMATVVVFVLGSRLAARSWRVPGAFTRNFERPIRTALGLVLLGLFLGLLPDFLASFLPSQKILSPGGISLSMDLNCTYGLFKFGWFQIEPAAPMAGCVAGEFAVNVVLVLIMVLLARRGLRKISPADHGKAEV
jgi:hypothetical protein